MKTEEINLKEYAIKDHSNVVGIFPLKEDDSREEFVVDGFDICFKLVENPKIKIVCDENFEGEVFEINGSRYSKEYIDSIKKIGSVWFGEDLRIFMAYDKSKEEFIKDQPISIVYGNNFCFVLAPRVEEE